MNPGGGGPGLSSVEFLGGATPGSRIPHPPALSPAREGGQNLALRHVSRTGVSQRQPHTPLSLSGRGGQGGEDQQRIRTTSAKNSTPERRAREGAALPKILHIRLFVYSFSIRWPVALACCIGLLRWRMERHHLGCASVPPAIAWMRARCPRTREKCEHVRSQMRSYPTPGACIIPIGIQHSTYAPRPESASERHRDNLQSRICKRKWYNHTYHPTVGEDLTGKRPGLM